MRRRCAMTGHEGQGARRLNNRVRVVLRRAVVETLERRTMLSGLLDSTSSQSEHVASVIADLTVFPPNGQAISYHTSDYSPINFPFSGGVATDQIRQPDGKKLVGGYVNGNFAVARYNVNGTLDQSFGAGGKVTTDFGSSADEAMNLCLRADGGFYLLGLTAATGTWGFVVARYNDDASLDSAFADHGKLYSGLTKGPQLSGMISVHTNGQIRIYGYKSNGDFTTYQFGANGIAKTELMDEGAMPASVSHSVKHRLKHSTRLMGIESLGRVAFQGPVVPSIGLAHLNSNPEIDEGGSYT